MKRTTAFVLLLFTLFFLSACTKEKQVDIVTTMFPQYDFARQIVGDKMTVSLLTPPGADAHSFEATSMDMIEIKNSKLFIFTSLEIDNWISSPADIGGENTIVMDLSKHYILADHHHHDVKTTTALHHHHHHQCSDSLHYWTDPTTAVQLIEAILHKIIAIDPVNQAVYIANATSYIETISNLDHDFKTFLQSLDNGHPTIFFAGHNAMGAFAKRYHLDIVSLFDDFKPDADLTSAELINFTNLVKEANAAFLFTEELVEPKAAKAIAAQLKTQGYSLTLLELHGYHNVTLENFRKGISYADLLEQNIENLKLALQFNATQ